MTKALKDYVIEIKIFVDKNINTNDRKEDIKEKDENNIDLPIINLNFYILIIIYIYQKEHNIISYVKCLILFYLYYFLYIANNINRINNNIYYNINLLNIRSRNS